MNMGKIFKETARMFAEREAIVNVERDRRFTFKELHKITNRICNMIEDEFGLREGDVFATLLDNDNGSLFGGSWCLKGIASALGLNIRDSIEEHLYQVDYLQPKLFFIENRLLDQYYEPLRERQIKIVCMEPALARKEVFSFWDLVEKASEEEPNVEYTADNVREHVTNYHFTGATTGRGKCVTRTVYHFLFSAYRSYATLEDIIFQDTRCLCVSPVTHVSGTLILPVHFKGGAVVTLNRADLELVCQTIEREKITLTYLVPTLLYRLLDMGLEKKYDLSSLKTIRYGASPISPAKLDRLVEVFGPIFVQGYSATEALTPVTALGKKEHIVRTEQDKKRLLSVGRVIPGVEIKIADESGNELPPGETGEIYMRGPVVVEEYYKDSEQTAENFTENGFWKSGDVGYMDEDGYLYLVDRKKDMIISGGFNIYSAEVEHVLNSHPAVRESAVIGIPHQEWGETVHAEVILKEESDKVTGEELIEYCRGKIAGYKMPKSLVFVDELPLSPAGKVLRRKVKEKYWSNLERQIH